MHIVPVDNLRTMSDLMIGITSKLAGMEGDVACKMGITPERLDDLLRGRIDQFQLLELQSLARRVGIQQ